MSYPESMTVMNSPTTNEMTNTRTVRFRTWMRVGHETFLSSDHDSLMNWRNRFTVAFSAAWRMSGRGDRTRTYNHRFWRPVLCQLSYAPASRTSATSPPGAACDAVPGGST